MRILPLTWHHLWWVPAIIAYYAFYTYLSKLNNDHSNIEPWYSSKYLWVMFIYGALCPFWVLVCRISKNLLFDGMLYDNAMFITYVLTMVALGGGSNFKTHQWIGVIVVLIGSILMRIEKWT